jgi:S-adenosylmethionine:tRNA ribosyltransferase-isomerase
MGYKSTGGGVELLIETILSPQRALVHCRASKRPKLGGTIKIAAHIIAEVIASHDNLLEIEFSGDLPVFEILTRYGQVPLPRYMQRSAETFDATRYQTVYAQPPGSVAAPTAGLHFDTALLEALQRRGIKIAYVTLHVGAGTFQPVRVEDLSQHSLHAEYAELTAKTCAEIQHAQQQGGRVIAVGTTTVRTLETAALSGTLTPFAGETRLFIRPGFHFNCVNALITNFHLPESTLLMLVCAFGSYTHVMRAYAEAITHKYRFYSYGDAMWITHAV